MSEPWRHQLVPVVLAVAGELLRESERLFRPHGISAAQYNVLMALMAHPEGISQRELSDVLVVDRSNVTGLLNRMERAGWVRRQDNPTDRRAYRVALTPAGRRLGERLARLYADALDRVTAGIAETPAKAAVGALRQLQEQATAWR